MGARLGRVSLKTPGRIKAEKKARRRRRKRLRELGRLDELQDGPGRRPTEYDEEVASEILSRISRGDSLTKILSDPDLPGLDTVTRWAVDDVSGFRERYVTAQQQRAAIWGEELMDIADNEDESPFRSSLRLRTRQWMLSKLMPRTFGDKLALTGPDGGPVALAKAPDEELLSHAIALASSIPNKIRSQKNKAIPSTTGEI